MSDTQSQTTAWVRSEMLGERPPPVHEGGAVTWLRANLFSGWFNILLTVLSLGFIAWFVWKIAPWFLDSTWNAASLSECREKGDGACFAVIKDRWRQLFFGSIPLDQIWRPILAVLLLVPALAPLLFGSVSRKFLYFTLIYPLIAWWLIWGGDFAVPVAFGLLTFASYLHYYMFQRLGFPVFGVISTLLIFIPISIFFLHAPLLGMLEIILPLDLPPHQSRQIGGFTLTFVLGISSISLSLPLGILLALGRQSHLPIIRIICVGFIEIIRGVPLITLLFFANVVLAYFLPPGTQFDLILRVIIMATLFASAYIAEVVRGGLAAIPKGQYEGADSLGLSYWQKMRHIVLPQALKISIPGIVNVFIGLFKDTTLVSIISMFDPIGFVRGPILASAEWLGVYWELYGFVALIFFLCCYPMSKYSQYLERRLQHEHE
ncbi:amino acid ABC transporter permease [Paracoccaceae bacterium GXU_MW_L88]